MFIPIIDNGVYYNETYSWKQLSLDFTPVRAWAGREGAEWFPSLLLLGALVWLPTDRQSRAGIGPLWCEQHGIGLSSTQAASQSTQCSLDKRASLTVWETSSRVGRAKNTTTTRTYVPKPTQPRSCQAADRIHQCSRYWEEDWYCEWKVSYVITPRHLWENRWGEIYLILLPLVLFVQQIVFVRDAQF